MTNPLHYGMFVQPGMVSTAKGEGHQFGMYASAQGGSRALLQHSSAAEMRFVCSPFAKEALAAEVASARSGKTRTVVESLDTFLRLGQSGTDAWLDMGGDTQRPHRFRRRIRGDYPIGVIQHSVSYGHCLHGWFLPLLVGDVREHDTVLCTTTAAKESIQKILDHVAEDFNAEHGSNLRYRGRLDVIPAGVDVDHFKPVPKDAARRLFKLSSDDTVLLFAGRISAQDKGDLAPLLRVLTDLLRRHPSLRLVMAGGARGDELQTLGKIATDLGSMSRITALGLVPHALLPSLYSAADIFISPADSLPETFGLTVVEAMACGLPVVASDWDGYKDTVVHGETGLLVPTYMSDNLSIADDLSEWSLPQGELVDVYAAASATVVDARETAKAIETLVADPSLRAKMGAAGRKRVVEKYAWPTVVRQYDELFTELREIPATKREGRPYTRTRLAEAFSHYPTAMIADETRVKAVSGRGAVRSARPQLGLVSEETAETIRATTSLLGTVSIGLLVKNAMPVCLLPEPQVRFHVAWLIKNGYLEIP